MREKVRSVVCLVLTFAMVLTGLYLPGGEVQAAEPLSGEEEVYKIYPTPQSLVYGEGTLALQEQANVVYEDGIDDATKNRLAQALEVKGIEIQESEQQEEGKLNILVGVKGSGEAADAYAEQLTYADDLFDQVDAYLLSIEDNTITILGKDTDAAFYGISSLKLILEQAAGMAVRSLQMEDYAIGQYRGFIEGYYGIPWSVEDRISLMNFGGDFKMNIYIFAPKDDPYHNSQWRELYPEDKLAEITEMVEAGAAAKCRFAWAIHPFMNSGINLSNYDESLEVIKAKFQQLYDAGVRQFVISADDASSNTNVQVKLLNDMSQWVKEHEGTYNLVFVPMIYCTAAANWGYGISLQNYYNLLKEVDEDVEFMWTGEYVCHPATQYTFDHFTQVSGREPFMWLNWPVNDVNHKRLVMGPAENCILNTGGVTGFKGIVTNPLEQGEASKTSLFAIADYAWNTADFDSETSWEDSFQYIDSGASESLHELCKHLTNPDPGGITGMAESKEIAPYVNAFRSAYSSGNDLTETGNALVEQFQKIVDAANDFQANGVNENLKDEMKPWVDSLRAISLAGIGYVKAAMALQDGDDNAAWANYCVAVNEYKISKNCEAPQLNGTIMVESGAKVLIPFASTMDSSLKAPMEEMLKHTFGNSTAGGGTAAEGASLIYSGLGGFYSGNAANITDGDESSYAWFNQNVDAGAYIGLDLGDQYRIDSVKILQGTSDTHGDIFSSAILEYSVDGENYTQIETISNTNNIIRNLEDRGIVGRFIRIRTAASTQKWYAIREFSVGTSPALSPAYTNAAALESMTMGILQNSAYVNTTEEPITLGAEEYIGIQLPKIREVTSVTATYDQSDELALEYSVDGVEWTEITEFVPPVDMAYLRIRNKGSQDVTFTLSELSLTNSDRNTDFLSTVECEDGYLPEYASDSSLTTAYLAKEGSGAGSLTWRISNPEQIGSVYILTYPGVETDATVAVQDTAGVWYERGALTQDLNIVDDLEDFEAIKTVKISWTTASPRIQEIYTTEPRAYGVTLNKTSSLLGLGKTMTLKTTVLVHEGEDATVVWTSDNPEIASVDENGVITGNALGTARITASVADGRYSAVCDIVVTDKVDPEELTITGAEAGSEEITNATSSEGPANLAIDGNTGTKWHSLWAGDNMENLWISVDLGKVYDVAELQYLPRQDSSYNGTILGYEIYVSSDGEEWLQVDEGIWAESRDWKSTDIVTEVPARYVKLQATECSSDQSANFASAAEIKILGYEHDDKLVDKRYAIAAGFESQITPESKYTEESYSAYMEAWDAVKAVAANVAATQEQVDSAVEAYRQAIVDLKVKVTGVLLSGAPEGSVYVGDTVKLTATVQPTDADNQNVTWTTTDPTVAEIAQDGTLTAVGPGTADITVTTEEGEYSKTISVTVIEKIFTVTFDANGGTEVTDTLEIKNGDAYGSLPETVRIGYTFLGWYNGTERITEDSVCDLEADATFTAKWEDLLVTFMETVDESQYTKESWAVFADALAALKEVDANPNATNQEIDSARTALLDAFGALEYGVQKIHLQVAVQAADAILGAPADYEEDSLAALKAVIGSAKEVLANENATQEAVNAAAAAVLDAIAEVKGNQDIETLESLIAAAESLISSKYTDESLAVLEAAIENAKAVVANPDRGESDLSLAYKKLADAIKGLELKGNKSALGFVIEKANEILANASDYVESSISGLEEVLKAAQVVYNKANATQPEVSAATEELTYELTKARLKGDVDRDGRVSTKDSAELLKYNAELSELTEEQLECADVNGDGVVDTKDAVLILQYASEKISAF